jgi:hypothetical protein
VSATGNIITDGYFLGNGSQLTGLPEIYGNANVSAYLASGTNTANIITTGNIVAIGNVVTTGNVVAANVNANITTALIGTPGATGNLDIIQPGAGYFSTTSLNLKSNLIKVGNPVEFGASTATVRSGSGQALLLEAAGNSEGSELVIGYNPGSGGGGGRANVVISPRNFGNQSYLIVKNDTLIYGPSGSTSTANLSVTGNITGNYFIGNGSQLTGVITTITYGNANVANFLSDGFGANTISTTGNITSGNLLTSGQISAAGNITSGSGSYFIGDGSLLTGIPASYGNANVANFLANGFGSNTITTTGNITTGNLLTGGVVSATGNVQGGNIITAGLITAVGNINGANLVASANLTSTQQTVVGTANVGTTGNIVVSGRNIATDMAYSPDGATGTAGYTGRVLVGTGWNGNAAVGNFTRLAAMDMINRGNTSSTVREFEAEVQVNLTANVSNNSFRQQAMGGRIRVGGGSAANVTALGSAFGAPFSMAAGQFNLDIGNVSPYFLGNTTISHASLNSGALILNAGSSIGNAYGYLPGVSIGGSGGTSNITNYIGVASSFTGANVTGNLFCFYNGNATSLGAYAVQTANTARAAANYYFLRNDDDVAQVKLGSLRSYNEYQYSTATSGTVNIDKTNAQIQYIAPTANVTIGDFQNFVTTASNSVSDINQTDTVTLIIKQGATPYTVTMPTGNAAIKYASGNSTVGSTANAVTMISVSAANVAGAALYMVTVSPEFT